jgi:membrane fusion protein (multidrug efflux system)
VQRVPVRIALDAKELAAHPLRVGLSMEARVDVADQGGKALAEAQSGRPVAQTGVFDTRGGEADAIVRQIIASNLGGATRATGSATQGAPSAPGAQAKRAPVGRGPIANPRSGS